MSCVPYRCPHCIEGQLYPRCPSCGGGGAEPEFLGDCPRCDGSGELAPVPCPTCGGSGRVARALGKLLEADRWVRANDPDWSGDDADRPGTTLYSLAMYYRRRGEFGSVVTAAGCGGESSQPGGVKLESADGKAMTLHGCSWGYLGEGASGLAAILADAGLQPCYEDARRWVAGRAFAEGWLLKRQASPEHRGRQSDKEV